MALVCGASRRGRLAFWSTNGGVLCAAAFTVWAFTAPVYASGATLLEHNPEPHLPYIIALPLGCAILVWLALHFGCRRQIEALRITGMVLAGFLFVLAMFSAATVGLFIAPAAVALLFGALLTPADGRSV